MDAGPPQFGQKFFGEIFRTVGIQGHINFNLAFAGPQQGICNEPACFVFLENVYLEVQDFFSAVNQLDQAVKKRISASDEVQFIAGKVMVGRKNC